MKLSKAFPSKYLKADDLNNQDLTVTIRQAEMEDIGIAGKKEIKLVLYFQELDKVLVTNKTNATVIANLYGDDTDLWIGKSVTLWPNHDVEFQGDIVSAIRVRSKAPSADLGRSVSSDRAALEDQLMDLMLLACDGDMLKLDDYLSEQFKVNALSDLSDAKLRLAIKKLSPKP